MDYKTLSEELVQQCLNKGAEAAEVFIETDRRLRIEVRNGEIGTVQESGSHGIGFRVFENNRMAFSHCNDFSQSALENAIDSAIKFVKHTTPDENNVLPSAQGLTDVGAIFDPEISRVAMEKKIEMAKTVEQLAMKDPRITKSDGARFSEGEGEVFLANSNGMIKNYKGSACSLGVSVVAEKGEQKSSGSEYCSRRFFSKLKSPEEIAAKAAQDALEMLDPRMVKTQKAPVIFDPDVGRTILGGILAAINGERVLQGASFLGHQLEKKIAAESITIIDDGTIPGGLASVPFDGEGVPTQKRTIVENGILKGFMYNTIVAKRAGKQSTGNASRRGYQSLPGIGPHNFYMTAGTIPAEDILKATKNGLLLKGVTGYGINPVNGNFSGGASGFWIENGRIAFPVKGLTIASTADAMLNSIDMLGNDLDLSRPFAAPTLRIPEMQIGGE